MTDKSFVESLRSRAGHMVKFLTYAGEEVIITMNTVERDRLSTLAEKYQTSTFALLRGYKILRRREPIELELARRKTAPKPKHLVLEPKSKFSKGGARR